MKYQGRKERTEYSHIKKWTGKRRTDWSVESNCAPMLVSECAALEVWQALFFLNQRFLSSVVFENNHSRLFF